MSINNSDLISRMMATNHHSCGNRQSSLLEKKKRNLLDLKCEVNLYDVLVYIVIPVWFLYISFEIHRFYVLHYVYAYTEEVSASVIFPFYELITFTNFMKFHYCIIFHGIVIAKSFNMIVYFERNDAVYLSKSLKQTVNDYIHRGVVKFIGKSHILLPNSSGVTHPIDYLVKRLYTMYNEPAMTQAFSEYKRTNPGTALKLDHLEVYSRSTSYEPDIQHEISDAASTLFSDAFKANAMSLGKEFASRSFRDVEIEGSSAAGYPYPAGTKRRDVLDEAIYTAEGMLIDDYAFDKYLENHVWYSTGRARLQDIHKPDKARLILYGGFAGTLLCMKYTQIWTKFMNRTFDWCAVGMSWMNGGARRFAKFFKAIEGKAPEGYRFVSVDIKEWDASLSRDLLTICKNFHYLVMKECGINDDYVKKFCSMFDDMINAKVLFPGGYLFQLNGGMKSGWCNTANDNTLMHEFIFRAIEKRLGCKILHQLYGDDNFMLVPDHISDASIVKAYAYFKLTVGTIHSSKHLENVDFLSKHVRYQGGQYFIYRAAVETHARILMPEELDPTRRVVPDARIAAERIIGHLFDNFYNKDVRGTCYKILEHLRDHYRIDEIIIDEEKMKRHPWRNIDPNRLMGVIPIIPNPTFIEDLYQVTVDPVTDRVPELDTSFHRFDWFKKSDGTNFDVVYKFVRDVHSIAANLSRNNRKRASKLASPYKSPVSLYGFHAARLSFASKFFNINIEGVSLDYGSHPGACAEFLQRYSQTLDCVTLKPERDARQDICPYILKQDNTKIHEMPADDFIIVKDYDFVHDDIDIVDGNRSYENLEQRILASLNRFILHKRRFKSCLMTLHCITPDIIEKLYDAYRHYGYFDIVKPLYSHPWKVEYLVYFRKTDMVDRMRKTNFLNGMNSYLDYDASNLLDWNRYYLDLVNGLERGERVKINPMQENSEMQYKFEDMVSVDGRRL